MVCDYDTGCGKNTDSDYDYLLTYVQTVTIIMTQYDCELMLLKCIDAKCKVTENRLMFSAAGKGDR